MRYQSIRTREDETKIDMTPMLDIVFIMLIFFIVTASFLKESGIPIRIPEGDTKAVSDKISIVIDISETNDVWLSKRRIDVRAIEANLKRRISELDDPSVVIRVHPQSRSEVMMLVVDHVRNAGIFDFTVTPVKE